MKINGMLPAIVALGLVNTLAGAGWDPDDATSTDADQSQDSQKDTAAPDSKFVLPPWLQLGGQIRGRLEEPSGTSLISNSPDAYYLSRIRLDLGIKPVSWLRFFVEAQDARVAGYNTSPAPSTINNPIDLRQGYVELKFEAPVTVTARVGRQELLFGDERIIGPADWGMSRTFDAADVKIAYGTMSVDLLAGSPVLINPTGFDEHKPGEHFYGAYGSIRNVLPGMNIEPILLFKENLQIKSETGVVGNALIASPGARVFGKTPGRVDYSGEMFFQWGSYSTDHVAAMGASYVAGWTMNQSVYKPRVSVEYNYASGDPNNKDGNRNTFDQFYPSNHAYYGMIDQFGWKNLKNARAGFDFLATKKFKLRADFNEFYLATVQDSLYGSSGSSVVLDRKATSAHIGSEANAVALYQWSKIWKFGAGFGHLFAGEYLKESKAGFGYNYPYVMFMGTI
jgi:alginate export protein